MAWTKFKNIRVKMGMIPQMRVKSTILKPTTSISLYFPYTIRFFVYAASHPVFYLCAHELNKNHETSRKICRIHGSWWQFNITSNPAPNWWNKSLADNEMSTPSSRTTCSFKPKIITQVRHLPVFINPTSRTIDRPLVLSCSRKSWCNIKNNWT